MLQLQWFDTISKHEVNMFWDQPRSLGFSLEGGRRPHNVQEKSPGNEVGMPLQHMSYNSSGINFIPA